LNADDVEEPSPFALAVLTGVLNDELNEEPSPEPLAALRLE
jgi:hypothetical protein